MCSLKQRSFYKTVAKLIKLRDDAEAGKTVCDNTIKHYAERVGKCGDADYSFKVSLANTSPLDKKVGGVFLLAPDDLDAKWVIKEL